MHDFINKNITPIWCPGCGLYLLEKVFADAMTEQGWNCKNTVVVSGIGCTARISRYFNCDSIQSTHGRAIALAEGIKLARPELNVVVFSGDGDLLGIGGNHLLNASRRNPEIHVFCNRNEIYSMTGGQTAPTTLEGIATKTSPNGVATAAVDMKTILTDNPVYFFGRTSHVDLEHLKQTYKAALEWKGFSYVEMISLCVVQREREYREDNLGKVTQTFNQKILGIQTEQENELLNKYYKFDISHS